MAVKFLFRGHVKSSLTHPRLKFI